MNGHSQQKKYRVNEVELVQLTKVVFIHNDNMKCFHVVVQETHKLVVMGHINFEDHALIKRRHACKKKNATGRRFKDEKIRGNYQKQFTFFDRSCACFLSFGIHNNMNAKSAIEKL
jgi:hypothetical protein